MGDLKASIVVNDHNPNPLGTLNAMGADDSDNDSIKSRKQSIIQSKKKAPCPLLHGF